MPPVRRHTVSSPFPPGARMREGAPRNLEGLLHFLLLMSLIRTASILCSFLFQREKKVNFKLNLLTFFGHNTSWGNLELDSIGNLIYWLRHRVP